MELYHKITKEVLELLLTNGAQMPVDLARKLQRSSSNMQQVREYLSGIGCISVTKSRNYYELKITDKGIQLLDALKQVEKLDNSEKAIPMEIKPAAKFKEEEPPEIKVPEEPQPDPRLKTQDEEISRGGRRGIMKRIG